MQTDGGARHSPVVALDKENEKISENRNNQSNSKSQKCSHFRCWDFQGSGSVQVLTNPAFTPLHMTETDVVLSPGVLPITESRRGRMFGDKRGGSPLNPPPTTWHTSLVSRLPELGALLCSCPAV